VSDVFRRMANTEACLSPASSFDAALHRARVADEDKARSYGRLARMVLKGVACAFAEQDPTDESQEDSPSSLTLLSSAVPIATVVGR
jgi:hypothetical protein